MAEQLLGAIGATLERVTGACPLRSMLPTRKARIARALDLAGGEVVAGEDSFDQRVEGRQRVVEGTLVPERESGEPAGHVVGVIAPRGVELRAASLGDGHE